MNIAEVFVRAKTSDDRWASVNVVDLDERSWRRFVAGKMAEVGIVCGIVASHDNEPLTTALTKDEAESAGERQEP